MTTEERLCKLEERVEKVEEKISSQKETQLQYKYELKELIRDAVEEANDKLAKKLSEYEQRLIKLENQDGEKAKWILKTATVTTIGWFVMGIINNLPLFFK